MIDLPAWLDWLWDPARHEFQPAAGDPVHCWACGFELVEHPHDAALQRRLATLREDDDGA